MNIAVLGHGTVGSALVELLDARDDITVKYILEIPAKCTEPRMVFDLETILSDDDVSLIVDALPAVHPSYEFMKKALLAGKHVVSSNKAALCFGFMELTGLAEKSGRMLCYEASCGGTIPCIKETENLSSSNEITACYGIMNGTTNFILDSMIREGSGFEAVLKKAQELGYAEADPTADLSGYDVKNKIVILSDTAYHGFCDFEFPVCGIEKLSAEVLKSLAKEGKTVKLLGMSVRDGSRTALGVAPVILPLSSLEANVPKNFNMVSLRCSNAGDLKLYGQGAGGTPTADAMVRDILSVVKNEGKKPKTYFDKKLEYAPELLTGTGLIRDRKERGTLEELWKKAEREDVFFAFEPDFI